jgi:hypothetical protein
VIFQLQLLFVVNFVECFPGMASKCFLKCLLLLRWFQLFLVQSYTSSSRLVLLLDINFAFYFLSCVHLGEISIRLYCHLHQYAYFHFFVFDYYIWFICITALSLFHSPVTTLFSHTGLGMYVCVCVCDICLSFRCLGLCILSNVNEHKFIPSL